MDRKSSLLALICSLGFKTILLGENLQNAKYAIKSLTLIPILLKLHYIMEQYIIQKTASQIFDIFFHLAVVVMLPTLPYIL